MYQGLQTAGQEALGQTQPQIQAQQAASQATQQGNYQAPTMTSQQIVQEAKDTGGTVNPFEVTQAAQNERPRPRPRPHHSLAKGGIVSINDLIRRM